MHGQYRIYLVHYPGWTAQFPPVFFSQVEDYRKTLINTLSIDLFRHVDIYDQYYKTAIRFRDMCQEMNVEYDDNFIYLVYIDEYDFQLVARGNRISQCIEKSESFYRIYIPLDKPRIEIET